MKNELQWKEQQYGKGWIGYLGDIFSSCVHSTKKEAMQDCQSHHDAICKAVEESKKDSQEIIEELQNRLAESEGSL